MKRIAVLWHFSRPHTIIGSIVSILTLYLIVIDAHHVQQFQLLFLALVIGVSNNVFIVGINQVADVEIDRINKPELPIPSGRLSISQAKMIVFLCLILSLALAFYVSIYLFIIILLSSIIGWAYSMPPLHLKRHHLSAALAIATVRGILINVGGFLVFNYIVNGSLEMTLNVRILAMFIFVFSIVIAWFKDLSDVEGDAKYNIRSLAVNYSVKPVLIGGHILLGLAYLVTILLYGNQFNSNNTESRDLFYGHLLLLVLFTVNAFSIRLTEQSSIRKFYKRFWLFFFAEYLLYLFVYLVK